MLCVLLDQHAIKLKSHVKTCTQIKIKLICKNLKESQPKHNEVKKNGVNYASHSYKANLITQNMRYIVL